MKLDTTKVHGLDFMFAIACYIQSSSLLSSFFVSITKQDSWIVVLIGFIICLPVVWVYAKLIEAFPGKNLFSMFQIVYGKYLGKFFCFLLLVFFITLTALNSRDLTTFVSSTIMTQTPEMVIAITFLLTTAWAVYVGKLKQMVKYGFILTMFSVVIVFLTIILTLNLMDWENFLPIFDLPVKNYIQGTNIVITIPFAEIVIFLMVHQNVDVGKRSFFFYFAIGVFIGCMSMFFVVIRDVAVLGNTITMFALPSFETLRMVSVTQALSRMEIVFSFILIVLLFFKVVWLYYISVLSMAQLFRFQNYKQLILLIGALTIILIFNLFPNSLSHAAVAQNVAPFIWLILEIGIPALTLLIGKMRGLTQNKKQGSKQNSSDSKPSASYQSQSV